MKKILLIIMISLLLTGCGKEKIYEDLTDTNFEVINDKIEVYSEVYLEDIINNKNNIELITNNFPIDTEDLGTKEYKIYYKLEDKKYVYKFNIMVVDTTEPRVISGTNKTIQVNYSGDLCDLIMYGDNYSGNVTCTIEGDYDLTKAGTYKVIYKLSDSSNNIKDVNVTLNVKEKINSGSSTPSTEKTYFTDIYNEHKKSNTEIGIDVSKWQGNIDFEKVKNAGATFVMMRIGVQSSRNGNISIDSYFKDNIRKAKEAGLKVGVYLYTMAGSIKEAKEHAEWVVDTLNEEDLDLPIAFDWENFSKWNSFRISFHEVNAMVNTFIETVQSKGYEGMLYSSKNYLVNIWENKKNYPVWLAHYTSKTNYEGKYIMWQMCNNGRIDGINGDVDIDILYY